MQKLSVLLLHHSITTAVVVVQQSYCYTTANYQTTVVVLNELDVQNEGEESTHSVADYFYLIMRPVLELSPCAQQPMMGDIFQVVCSSAWGIFFFVSRSRPMGLNALGYQSHVQQRRHLAYGHEAKIK